MKKEATKKSKLWIWLVAGIVLLLAVAGGVLALVLGGGFGGQGDTPKGGRADLYWNLDRATYTQNSESGLSTREPGEDGVYRVRYAYNGEVVEIPVSDKQLVNYIDTMDCMGIVQDASGVIIDVVDPKTLATETARMFYVRKASDTAITLNSSMAMNGMTMEIPIAEVTQVYDVATNAEVPGAIVAATVLQPMDSVTVYSNALGEATHVYVISHPVESPVYWRADTGTYDSTLKQTKRIPDENGYYTIPFYVDGEYVELKCNVQGIVNTIDNKNRFKAHTGLVLDENGYIVDNMLAATGIRGLLGCEMYDVIEVNGTTFTAENQLSGKMDQYTKTLAADAKIYNVSLAAKPDVRGKAVDTLQVGDRIVTFENTEGEVILVFVAHRLVDSQMYFNVTKKYNSTEKSTTRTPNGSGWYTIEMMDEEGVIRTYKTKDKALVTKIDSQNNRSVALELDGDVITYVWEGECVAGYGAFVGYSITNVTGSILSMAPSTSPDNISNRIMTADCKVFDMSGRNKGATTTPQVGDYCIMWRNGKSEINYIYVVRRLVDAPIYFSVTRKWDSTTQQTKREPVDGYYVYECIRLGGEKVTVKTASKEVANFLDSQSPQTFALKVDSKGVIYDYYETFATTGGNKAYLNYVVKRLDVLVLYNTTNQKTYTPKMADNCKIYNFSTVYTKNRGETTTLRMDDSIQCYTNMKGEIAIILVRQRKADMKMAWNVNPQYDKTEKKTTRTPGADGLYEVELAIDGKISKYKVNDAAINYMDSANGAVACTMNNGVVVGAQSAIYGPGVWTSTEAAVIATVLKVEGKTLTVKTTKSSEPVKITMNSKYVCYDVSGEAEFVGQAATAKVGDYGRIYLNEKKQAMFFYIQSHGESTAPIKLYWNVDRQKDANGSTRQPDADGWYWIDLAVEGEVKTFKTNSKKIIDYIDQGNAGAVALTVKGNQITATNNALGAEGVGGTGKSGTVQAVNGNKATISGVEVTLAADCKVYDAVVGSETIGQYITLGVGDVIARSYANANGELNHIYVQTRANVVAAEPALPDVPVYDNSDLVFEEGTTKAMCTYCGEVKEWVALQTITSSTELEAGVHYYLAEDIENSAYYSVVNNCIHLNGHNITSSSRVFAVANGTTNLLNVMGNGVVTGAFNSNATANVAGATISCRGNLNLIGGTYKHAASSKLPTIIMAKPQQTANIYEGVTIEGTAGTTGTNLYVMMGVVNMYGGTIKDGVATPNGSTGGIGDNVYVHGWTGTGTARAEFNMYGGFVDGGIYAEKNTETYKVTVAGDAVISEKNGGLTLDHKTGAKMTIVRLSESAKIYVTGDGVLSVANAKAAQYVNNQILPAAAEITLKAENNAIVASGLDISEPEPQPEPVWVMAYMAEPAQYNSTDRVTTRTPEADGYYYVKLAVNGVVNTYKTNQRGVDENGNGIDYADQTANKYRSFAICLTSEDSFEFTSAKSALFAPNSKKAGTNGTVAAIEGNTVTLTSDTTATLADNVVIYDVSVATDAAGFGAATQLTVGDEYMSYANDAGQLTYVYVKVRAAVVDPDPTPDPEPTPDPVPTWVMAYLAEPAQYDSATTSTTRTAEADGYYYVKLTVNGEIKTYKTNQRGVDGNGNGIDYVDQSGFSNRAFAICLTDANSVEFTSAKGATYNTGAKGAKVVTITGINGNTVTADGYEATVAADAKLYDVSEEATVLGEVTELRVGDYVRFYTAGASGTGEILYAYVYTRATVKNIDMNTVCETADAMASVFANGGEVQAECPACGKTVTWQPIPKLSSASIKLESGHYYFDEDQTVSSTAYYSISNADAEIDVCIHLNGKTFQNTNTGNSRSFYVDNSDKLTIMGSGNVIGARGVHATVDRAGSTLEVVGKDAIVNICGGTWSKTNDTLDVIGIRGREGAVTNIYNGTVINIGDVQGNALWVAGGEVNLLGGEINGDVVVREYATKTATLNYAINLTIADIVINGKVHYRTDNGEDIATTLKSAPVIAELAVDAALPVQIGRLTKGAEINVNATGAFTAANPNLQDYVDAGFVAAAIEGKTVTVTDGVASIVDATAATGYDNSNLVFEEGTTKAMCTYCGEVKEWTAIQPDGNGTTISVTNGGHYYLATDLLNNTSRINCSVAMACIHLNGKTLQTVGTRAISVQTGAYKLNIMGNGNVSGGSETTAAISCGGDLNLIGGTYSCSVASQPVISHTRSNKYISVYEDVVINGNEGVTGSAINYTYGNFNLYGGTINGNIYLKGNNGSTAVISKFLIDGGVIDGGVMIEDASSESFLTVSGNAVITAKNGGLNYCKAITLDRLTKGAEIYVTADDGAITVVNAKAADYLDYGYIKSAVEGKQITEKDGVLSIG